MKKLTIGWLYPELMNIYGDMGNIICLTKRCEWREIKVEVKRLNPGFSDKELKECNLLIMGGAQDKQQSIVNNDLKKHKKILKEMIENGIPGLFICGGFQFLGNYYKDSDGNKIEGLEIFDLHTISPGLDIPRLIGNVVIKPNIESISTPIVGFENHGGRTTLGKNLEALGEVLKGYGNKDDGLEGARYKNSFGTYLHGPILPKNPQFADYLLKLALQKDELKPLDDELEIKAQAAIAKRLDVAI
jgi:CobQ-like glutamine amidotransferase family enzyme